jgi:hypothetical protein
MKTEVYSWRVSTEVKESLEEEARLSGASVAAVLDRITRAWIEQRRRASGEDERAQARIRKRALQVVGTVAGDDPYRAERARDLVRRRLRDRRAQR